MKIIRVIYAYIVSLSYASGNLLFIERKSLSIGLNLIQIRKLKGIYSGEYGAIVSLIPGI